MDETITMKTSHSMRNIFAVLICTAVIGLTPHDGWAEFRDLSTSLVRVALIKSTDNVTVSIRSDYTITDPAKNTVLMEGRRLRKTVFRVHPNGIAIGDKKYSIEKLRIQSRKDITILIGDENRRFRGQIDIIKNKKGKLLVINSLALEAYVKGVLYHEVSHRWPMETTKAQAIATRTYALYQMKANADLDYDVSSDIYSQVYGGRSAERYRTNIAADRTEGLALSYDGKILPAYYHANCGGHTEDVSELWEEDLPPLKGLVCPFSTRLPHAHWKKNFQLTTIQNRINARGYSLAPIKEIKVLDRNNSGRIKNLAIRSRTGQNLKLSGKRFRNMIGPNEIKSNNYDVHMKGYYVDFIGKGWGHGVGFCQWGAYEMANQKYDYINILQFYYPKTKVVDYQTLGPEALMVDVDALRKEREKKRKRRLRSK